MFFDKFDKIKWERFKLEKFNYEFDFSGNITEALYLKIPQETRAKIESFIWDNAIVQIRKYLGAKKKEFVTSDGVKISYLECGDPCKDKFVFLHGFGDVKENFFSLAKTLSNQFHVILPDLPGFGESEKGLEHVYNLENYGRWFNEFFEKIVTGPIHILGNSLGGGVILQLALQFPHHFKSLGLLDAAGVVPLHSRSIYDELNCGVNLFSIESIKQFDLFLARVFVNMPYVPTPLKIHMYHSFKNNRELFEKILNDMGNGLGQRRDLNSNIELALNNHIHKIKIPTIIFWGEEDSLFPVEVAAILHTQISTSNMVIFENTGHCPQIEAPKKVLKRYQDFVNREK